MVAHESEQVEANAEIHDPFGQTLEKAFTVPLVTEQPIPGLSPRAQHATGNMVDGPWEFDAQGSSYAPTPHPCPLHSNVLFRGLPPVRHPSEGSTVTGGLCPTPEPLARSR